MLLHSPISLLLVTSQWVYHFPLPGRNWVEPQKILYEMHSFPLKEARVNIATEDYVAAVAIAATLLGNDESGFDFTSLTPLASQLKHRVLIKRVSPLLVKRYK